MSFAFSVHFFEKRSEKTLGISDKASTNHDEMDLERHSGHDSVHFVIDYLSQRGENL